MADELATREEILQLLLQQQWTDVFKLLDDIEVAQDILRVKLGGQGIKTRGNVSHDDLYEVALVDQVHHELGIDTKGVKTHDDDIIEEVLLAGREHAFRVSHVVDKNMEWKTNIAGNCVFYRFVWLLLLRAGQWTRSSHRHSDAGGWISLHLVGPQVSKSLVDTGSILVQEPGIFFAEEKPDKADLVLDLEDQGVDELQDVDGVEDNAWPLLSDESLARSPSTSEVSIDEGYLRELVINGPQNLTDTCVYANVRQDARLLTNRRNQILNGT